MDRQFDGLTADLAVGEIRALRTFRWHHGDGSLRPVYFGPPWTDGVNHAVCRRAEVIAAQSRWSDPDPGGEQHPVDEQQPAESHRPPDEQCSCGFYGYGQANYTTAQQTDARHLLAVMAASGVVIAGTRGIRAENARIEAVWLGRRISDQLAARIAARYPGVQLYRDREAMLADYPPTPLDCYEPWPTPGMTAAWRAAIFVGFAAGLLSGVSQHNPLMFPLLLVAGMQLLLTVITFDIYRRPLATAIAAATLLWTCSAFVQAPFVQASFRIPFLLTLGVVAARFALRRPPPAAGGRRTRPRGGRR